MRNDDENFALPADSEDIKDTDVDKLDNLDKLDDYDEDGDYSDGITVKWPEEYSTLITKERLIALIAEYKEGDSVTQQQIRNVIVGGFQKLVSYAIRKWYRQFIPTYSQDLYQEGCLAIQQEMLAYKPAIAPSTYFTRVIKHALQVYIAEEVYGTSRHYAAAATKIKKAEDEMYQIDGLKTHSDIIIAQITGLSLTTIAETRRHMNANNHMEFGAVNELTISEGYSSPDDELYKDELSGAIDVALSKLTNEERRVIKMMHGLGDGPAMTASEIAKKIGLSVDKVRILAQDAQRKLALDKNLASFAGTVVKKPVSNPMSGVPFLTITVKSAVEFFDYETRRKYEGE